MNKKKDWGMSLGKIDILGCYIRFEKYYNCELKVLKQYSMAKLMSIYKDVLEIM